MMVVDMIAARMNCLIPDVSRRCTRNGGKCSVVNVELKKVKRVERVRLIGFYRIILASFYIWTFVELFSKRSSTVHDRLWVFCVKEARRVVDLLFTKNDWLSKSRKSNKSIIDYFYLQIF